LPDNSVSARDGFLTFPGLSREAVQEAAAEALCGELATYLAAWRSRASG
jgi:hypothetical protein